MIALDVTRSSSARMTTAAREAPAVGRPLISEISVDLRPP